MSRYFTFTLVLIGVVSCNNTSKETPKEYKFESKKILIDLSYPPYEDSIVKEIMHEVKLCLNSSDKKLSDSLKIPPCKHEWFRVFDNTGKGYKNGFLVEVKKGIYSDNYQVINIRLVEDEYIVTNNLKGELLEIRTTPSGCYDILVRYKDKEVGTVTIIHIWNGIEYEPLEVLEINDHFVKDSKKDSLYERYITNFVWGY